MRVTRAARDAVAGAGTVPFLAGFALIWGVMYAAGVLLDGVRHGLIARPSRWRWR